MSQDSVYKLLEKTGRWMNAVEIKEALDLNLTGVRTSISRLFRYKHITMREVTGSSIGRKIREYKVRETSENANKKGA